jgi:hypothetical protein
MIPDTTRPAQILNLVASNPTNNSVNLTWTAPADNGTDSSSGPIKGYEIRYSTSPITNATWSLATKCTVPKIPGTPGSIERYTVTGLDPEITYYFAIKAVDENNNWAWVSNSPSNTTLEDPDLIAPSAVSDLTATNPTYTTINLTWTAVGDDGNTGTASYYDIRYSTSPITNLTWSTATQCINEPNPQSPGNTEYFQVIGLNHGTRYYFAIKVGDEVLQLSGLSNIAWNITIMIPDTTRPAQIQNLVASNPTNNSVNLTWTAPADNGPDSSSGAVKEYEIRYSTSPITNATWPLATKCTIPKTPGNPGTIEKYMVTGLDPETTYYFAIRSVDENSNWAWISNCPSNSTLKDPDLITPGKITDLMAIGPSQTSINLTWTAVGDDGYAGTASFYDIRYSTSPITGKTWSIATQCINEPTPQSSGKIEYFQVVGLEPDTKYYFAIRVGDETPQWSPLSNRAWNITLVKPDLTPPGKITDLTVKFTNSTSVTLSWTAPGDDGYSGTVAGYDIRYFIYPITEAIWNITNQVNGFPEPVMAGNNQNFTITGLIANQQYYFALIAYDDWPNYSPLSNIANSTTETSDDVTPPSEISNLTAFTISVNAIRLTWTAVGDDGSLWTATGYDIRYSTIPITAENWASANQCFNEPIPQKPGTNEMYIVMPKLFKSIKCSKCHNICIT